MRVLSYGEDPLTYWALTQRLEEVFAQLGDPTSTNDAVVNYRPSFGRAAGPQFGEFDAVVGTSDKTYLIEAKWHGSPEISGGTVTLRPEQYKRHEIFRWYRKAWSEMAPNDWDHFLETAGVAWAETYPDGRLAPSGSVLARNLEFVLGQLSGCGPAEDVVLFVGLEGTAVPHAVGAASFRLVTLTYSGMAGTGYFELVAVGDSHQ